MNKHSMSEEVYFGMDNPLRLCLLKYSRQLYSLKESIKTINKKNIKEFQPLLDEFGEEVAKIINAELVQFSIADLQEYAFSTSMMIDSNFRKVDRKTKQVSVDQEFYNSLKEIMIEDKTGYRFKDPNNKKCLISFSLSLFDSVEFDEFAAILCHEIGHCLQQGVVGILSEAYEKTFYDFFENMSITELGEKYLYLNALNDDTYKIETDDENNDAIVYDTDNINNKFISLRWYKQKYKKKISDAIPLNKPLKYLLYKKLCKKVFDKKEEEYSKNALGTFILTRSEAIPEVKSSDRTKIAEYFRSNNENNIKSYYLAKSDVNKKPIKLFLFFSELASFLSKYFFDTILNTLNLVNMNWVFSSIAKNGKHNDLKGEQFADAFATSNGLGPQLALGIKKLAGSGKDIFGRNYKTINFLYEVPGANLIFYYNDFLEHQISYVLDDCHPSDDVRLANIYYHLKSEIKNNPELSSVIDEQMAQTKKAYDDLICGKDIRSFSYRIFNRLFFGNKFKNFEKSKDYKKLKTYVLDEIDNLSN